MNTHAVLDREGESINVVDASDIPLRGLGISSQDLSRLRALDDLGEEGMLRISNRTLGFGAYCGLGECRSPCHQVGAFRCS